MTSPSDPTHHEFEERLRQVLRAEADSVAPSPEALNMIRERTEQHRGSAWFGLTWLRPAVAVAGAALIAASVIMSSPQVRDQVLEIVPAGADREGTPPEQDGGPELAAPDPTSGSASDTAQPHTEPEESPGRAPSADDEDTSDDDGGTSRPMATCAPVEDGATPTPTPTSSAEARDRSTDDDCEPTDDSTSGGGEEVPGDSEDDSDDTSGGGDSDADGDAPDTGSGDDSGTSTGSGTTSSDPVN